MAKKRTKKRNNKSLSLRLSKLERRLLWLLVVVIVYFAYTQLSSKKSTEPQSSYELTANMEIPKLQTDRAQQILRHAGYTVSYNPDYRIANWVAYELTEDEAEAQVATRKNTFYKDPAVKGVAAISSDYSRSGYDRGHLAPAADMRWSADAMRQSFYLSNICPQEPGLNRGPWAALEDQCREWAKEKDRLFIATGPILSKGMKRIGENDIAVPHKFYKVLCASTNGVPEVLAFVFDNKDYKDEDPEDFVSSVDSVEDLTGIDFFPSLPDDIEKQVEAKVSLQNWRFN